MHQDLVQFKIKSRVMLGNASVFQFATHKHKDEKIQNYNFACFLWVWYLVAHNEGRIEAEGVWE